jgi:peptidoglycan hydrolase-like amidase
MLLASLAIAALPLWQSDIRSDDVVRRSYAEPIDAVSILLPSAESSAEVRGRMQDGTWSSWEPLELDDEQEPGLLESSLVIFPDDTVAIELRGTAAKAAVHPIRVDDAPVTYKVAGPDFGTPKILSREDWGANDDLLFTDRAPSSTGSSDDVGDAPIVTDAATQREQDCLDAQRNYPDEFKTTKKTTTVNGSTLLWPHTYSKEIDLIVVHHTAVAVAGDKRSGVERVRAIYSYHAQSRGWGDVGYNYLIDEEGQIYEGKAGGKYVVAGHAYCHNVNTIGVALLGNFEVEKPSQDQMKALQWLIDDLADEYDVDLDDNATYHGETYSSPILGHGDLLSTSCPGFYVRKTLNQVRDHVEDGDLTASISFPKKPTSSTSSKSSSSTSSRSSSSRSVRSSSAPSSKPIVREGISALGTDTLAGRPGGEVPFSVRYTTGATGAKAGDRIAKVERSDQAIGVWQMIAGEYVPVRGDIVTESSVPRNSTTSIQLKVQIPLGREGYWIKVGDAKFSIQPSGRATTPGSSSSVRSRQSSSSSSVSFSRRPAVPRTSSSSRVSSSSSKSSVKSSSSRSSSRSTVSDRGPMIEVRLESRDAGLASCDDANLSALKDLYRGTLKCVTVDGKPTIVNTVALEDYLMGLSEEPDTEPYEKQRAFAIAARTYAAHYMGDAYRKFPGKPYDGSDSPAIFQKYTGKSFEKGNPRWLEAVADTANIVITKDSKIIRPPYFSSDDGKTKNPADIGWGSFPFAEVFYSKPDPWCDGMENRGHGVGMSGCGAEGQANEGATGEEILKYYYPGTKLRTVVGLLD